MQRPYSLRHVLVLYSCITLEQVQVLVLDHFGKDYTIGSLHYNWPRSAHASQCTDSVIMPSFFVGDVKCGLHEMNKCNSANAAHVLSLV